MHFEIREKWVFEDRGTDRADFASLFELRKGFNIESNIS